MFYGYYVDSLHFWFPCHTLVPSFRELSISSVDVHVSVVWVCWRDGCRFSSWLRSDHRPHSWPQIIPTRTTGKINLIYSHFYFKASRLCPDLLHSKRSLTHSPSLSSLSPPYPLLSVFPTQEPVGVDKWVEHPPPVLRDRGIRRSWVRIRTSHFRTLVK